VGKTSLLTLTAALLKAEYPDVAKQDFTRLTVIAEDGTELMATRRPDGHGSVEIHLVQQRRGVARAEKATITVGAPKPDVQLPGFIEQRGDVYLDTREGEMLTLEELVYRYPGMVSEESLLLRHGRIRRGDAPQPPPWFKPECWQVDLIETKRLDTEIRNTPRSIKRRRVETAPIHRYLNAVAEALERARRDSARINQAQDRSFARRLLTKASRMSVNADALRRRYKEVGERASHLTENGLLADTLDVLPAGGLNPTEKRILSLFLDDFEAKLEPLDPVSAKLDRLRSIVGTKFLNKEMEIDPAKGVVFLAAPHRQEIPPEALSSGEQHELALISRLLFSEQPGTTVFIDEPELSLHVGWQHRMLQDLAEIAEVADLSFVLATHSTAIINGRWDVVEEIGSLAAEDEDTAGEQSLDRPES
jgi:hypothetical protein